MLPSPAKKFYFKNMTPERLLKILDAKKPIKLRGQQDLIDRVYERYPVISKTEIALIVRAFFVSLRDLLIKGETLNIVHLFTMFRINCYQHPWRDKLHTVMRVRIETPKRVKRLANEDIYGKSEEDE